MRAAVVEGYGAPLNIRDIPTPNLGDDDVLVISSTWRGNQVVTAHNFAAEPKSFRISLKGLKSLTPMLTDDTPLDPLSPEESIDLSAHGYCWLRCNGERR